MPRARRHSGQSPRPRGAPVYHKFHAKPTVHNGVRFDSKAEARYAAWLDLQVHTGRLVGYLTQVPVRMPGFKYVCDFLEFWSASAGELANQARFVDIKGVETATFKLKARALRQHEPWIDLVIIKAKDVPRL